MKSNNLTISIPTPRCKKNCPYCVSKMTGRIESNPKLFFNNVKKVQTLAEQAGVTSVLITGKGEPLDSLQELSDVATFFERYPLEVQVNGDRYMEANESELNVLRKFDVVALSFDYIPKNFLRKIDSLFRMTFIITDQFDTTNLNYLVEWCSQMEIDQLSLRKPTVPGEVTQDIESSRAVEWISQNTKEIKYEKMIAQFESLPAVKLRELNFGATVYDIQGVSFTHFDYCVQDQNNGDDIRSLIYMEDGHLYTSWSFKSSKIF